MDNAYCIDGRTYFATAFARKTDAERDEFRGKLECGLCGADAHFRKKSITGRQKAHFAAFHRDECELIIGGSNQGLTGQSSVRPAVAYFGDRLVIRNVKSANTNKVARSDAKKDANVRYATTKHGSSKSTKKQGSIGLNSVLAALINDEDFRSSDRVVEFADFPQLPASEFFVPLLSKNLDEIHGEYRGFWGKIVTIGFGPSGVWLNNGDNDGPNIWIPDEHRSEANRRFGFNSVSNDGETIALVLGRINRSSRTKYIKIDDLSRLAIATV